MKKIFFLFIFIFCFNSTVFGAEYVMTEELAEEILDYYRQGSAYWAGNSTYIGAYGGTIQNILDSLTAENFATYFNTYMQEVPFDKTGSFKNLTVLFEVLYQAECRFTFLQTNNTFPDGLELPYLSISQSGAGSTSYKIFGTNSLLDNTDRDINFLNLIFKSTGLSSIASGDSTFNRYMTNITFNNDETIIYIPSLLALSKTQFLYYTPYNSQKNGYFIGNTVSGNYDPIPPDLPTGDGETVSPGDMPSGDYTAGIVAINNNIIKIHDGIVELNGKIATSGDIQAIIGAETNKIVDIFSGDTSNINSGDSSILTDNEYQIDDPTEDILTGTFQQIADVMMTVDDSPIQTDFMGKQIELRPDYWKIPDSPLKALFVAYFSYWVGKTIILDIRKTINKFKEGNFEQIATEDITADMV